MRVIGGRLKGRNIASPSSNDIRPTQDRLREALFNILMHAYENPIDGARVLDLFAGTGALGIEAVSRGAAFTLFVDNGAEARALLRNNVEALGLGGVTKVYRRERPISVRPIRWSRSRWCFSIRPTSADSRIRRFLRCATASG